MKILFSFLAVFFCAHVALSQATAEEDFVEDFPVDGSLEAVLEEEPAPLEAPYTNAEKVELDRAKRKRAKKRRNRKRRSAPLPSVFEDTASGPNVKGGRVKKRYIKHPLAAKGLYKITKDGDYLYQVQKTPTRASIAVRFGIFDAPNLINANSSVNFTDLYGGDDPIMFFSYEWKLEKWMRNLSLILGSGLMIASGNGRLETGDKAGQESLEKFTLIMLPNHAGLSYKFKFTDTQTIVPYIEGGGGYYVFNEQRDDNEPPFGRWGGALNIYAVGGVAFSISDLDRDSSIRLDADYGINGIWLTAELRQLIGFGTFDLTSTMINGGIVVHF